MENNKSEAGKNTANAANGLADNGKTHPAFPTAANWDGKACNVGAEQVRFPGITKRDYFAAQALVGILSSPSLNTNDIGAMARSAVMVADAMISALGEP